MSPPAERILVVGAALAGLRGAEALRAEGFDGELMIVGEERRRPYDRPPLSKELLSGRLEPADVELRSFGELHANWRLDDPAISLDCVRRRLMLRSGEELSFDRLLIATGSRPRRLPVLDAGGAGIHELRTLDDALALRSALAGADRLAIVGAGFIGVEVASTARSLGLEVEMVSLDPPLAVAGGLVSDFTARLLEDHGVRLHTPRTVIAVQGSCSGRRLLLDDQTSVEADVVLSAVGARPAVDWLQGSGLEIDDGIVCDEWCLARGVHGVAAAGDVARWPHALFGPSPMRVEHWSNAGEQARAAARALMRGPGHGKPYAPVPSFWSEHFGVRLQSIGLPERGEEIEVVAGDVAERRFTAVARRDGQIVGAVAYGMPRPLAALRTEIAARAAGLPFVAS